MARQSVDEILDFAIQREQEAHDFYMELAQRVDRPGVADLLRQFAGEELGHRKRLEALRHDQRLAPAADKVQDLRIADYTVDVAPDEDLDYARSLILAMKREKASFRLYTTLADAASEPELKQLLQALAQDEARHKLRFEIEYDDAILGEN